MSTKTYQNATRIDAKQQISFLNSLKTKKNHFLEPKTTEICSKKSENKTFGFRSSAIDQSEQSYLVLFLIHSDNILAGSDG
mgnify:CR=1 FL=1